jgi:hypothetical protein
MTKTESPLAEKDFYFENCATINTIGNFLLAFASRHIWWFIDS